MQLQDALYNWLSIKIVAEARPKDEAAQDTCEFFEEILTEDHGVERKTVTQQEHMYTVHYWIKGSEESKQFPIQLIDALLRSIETEPRYNHQ